uniref:Uncharacterized protein n=1 Tax=Plectus sambesii TaxID=2011161 RepID=A0A914XFP8_9BILA
MSDYREARQPPAVNGRRAQEKGDGVRRRFGKLDRDGGAGRQRRYTSVGATPSSRLFFYSFALAAQPTRVLQRTAHLAAGQMKEEKNRSRVRRVFVRIIACHDGLLERRSALLVGTKCASLMRSLALCSRSSTYYLVPLATIWCHRPLFAALFAPVDSIDNIAAANLRRQLSSKFFDQLKSLFE